MPGLGFEEPFEPIRSHKHRTCAVAAREESLDGQPSFSDKEAAREWPGSLNGLSISRYVERPEVPNAGIHSVGDHNRLISWHPASLEALSGSASRREGWPSVRTWQPGMGKWICRARDCRSVLVGRHGPVLLVHPACWALVRWPCLASRLVGLLGVVGLCVVGRVVGTRVWCLRVW